MNHDLARRARASAAKGALATLTTAGVAVGLTSAGVNTTATGLAMAATLGGGLAAVTYATSQPRPRETEN
ncbi:hypothetical protein SMD44_00936 [Streptomyces alboflavus]|uniref:Holin n=1 Tax=Streptomyces alboflavus TaxID=67267 RepID=A0A1Z1W526_9ACTN|nr:hypothetical protein [Streptomyces alboflavus]ARX81538.1 hypothetical protein SMD44_00936 [Streptomyces alboflavus]